MKPQNMLSDAAVGLVSGFVGTKLMEPVLTAFYDFEPRKVRRREDAVRPGQPMQVAADKAAHALGLRLSGSQQKKLGTAIHYGLGMSWAPVYSFFARKAGLHPMLGGLMTGAAVFLLVDEIMTPALKLSAPNRDYPLVTHVRGFVGHLAYGLGVAFAAQLLMRLLGNDAHRQKPMTR